MNLWESTNVKNAISLATRLHEGQTRKNGAPYIQHPFRVAKNVLFFAQSQDLENLVAASILHDAIEDTNCTYNDLKDEFNDYVADLVLELTNDKEQIKKYGKTEYLKNKMVNMSNSAFIIKLCDRLDNVCDLKNSDDAFIKKYSQESIKIINHILNQRMLSYIQVVIIKCILNELQLYLEHSILLGAYNKVLENEEILRSGKGR